MNRTIKKQFWVNRKEDDVLKEKAKKTGLPEAALIRLLVMGFEPKEKPDAEFFRMMRELSAIGNNINQLAMKANAFGLVEVDAFFREADRLQEFRKEMEERFLCPDKEERRWQ